MKYVTIERLKHHHTTNKITASHYTREHVAQQRINNKQGGKTDEYMTHIYIQYHVGVSFLCNIFLIGGSNVSHWSRLSLNELVRYFGSLFTLKNGQGRISVPLTQAPAHSPTTSYSAHFLVAIFCVYFETCRGGWVWCETVSLCQNDSLVLVGGASS